MPPTRPMTANISQAGNILQNDKCVYQQRKNSSRNGVMEILGSIKVNGKSVAEQIGAFYFVVYEFKLYFKIINCY